MIQSASRAYLESPIRLECSLGITPIHSRPKIGHRWCEQVLRMITGPTIINSFRCSILGNWVMPGSGT